MEQQNQSAEKPIRRPRRSRYTAPVGGAFIVLAIVGLVAVVWGSIQLTRGLLDNSKEVEKLERMLMPVVMFDPVPFDKVEDADPVMVLQASLWTTLYSEKRDSYTTDDNSRMLVPASDVEVACAKLFGTSSILHHQSFGDLENTFVYDEENKLYRVPVMATAGYYSPSLEKGDITKKGNIIELRVGYVAPGSPWLTDTTGKKYSPKPDKYMIYQVQQEKGEYRIVGLKDPGETVPGEGGSGATVPSTSSGPSYPKPMPETQSSSEPTVASSDAPV